MTNEYEHAGTWNCEMCGGEFEVENKLDPLSHALSCDGSGPSSPMSRPDGYVRRRERLQEAR